MTLPITSIQVEERIGQYMAPRVTARLEDGVLTVKASDDGYILRIFRAGDWKKAWLRDGNGLLLEEFIA